MEIRVVDFDVLTKNYTKYQEGILNLSNIRNSFIDRIEPIKKEMESIINAANNGLILDPKTQDENNKKFNELQDEAMSIDNNYKVTMRKEQDELNKRTYEELSTIINEWTEGKNVDLVMGKMEVVWVAEKNEITEDILSILKDKNLYKDFNEVNNTNTTTTNENLAVEDFR
jgi:Skp family chaperone for outer membrane proteins